jgi:sarcosine oxidase
MALRAQELWRELEDASRVRLLMPTGGLDIGPGAERCAEAMQACGVPSEWLSAREAEERFPGVSLSDVDRVLFQADSGACLADRTVATQVEMAADAGVRVWEQTPVTAVRPRGEAVLLETARGEVAASVVVMTGGGWEQGLLAGAIEEGGGLGPLKSAPMLTATLQQVSYFGARDSTAAWPTLIEWEMNDWYVVPPEGGAAGIKIGGYVPGRAVDPRDGPFEVEPRLARRAASYVQQRLPGVDPEPLLSETCLYTLTADEDFVLDRVGPIVVGGGCSGHAFKFGPLLGEALADLATGKDPGLPAGRFSVTRDALFRPFEI